MSVQVFVIPDKHISNADEFLIWLDVNLNKFDAKRSASLCILTFRV